MGDINVTHASTNYGNVPPYKFHCIVCGCIWGEGDDIKSFGICISCFANWAKVKVPCFGETPYIISKECSYRIYCKEYYEFKHNLLR